MIIRDEGETYKGSFRFVMYETDGKGKLAAQERISDLEDQIPIYYEQRKLEMMRLERQVVEGEISPIALCMTYQQMTLADLASRAKTSKRHVRAHLTPKGFRDLTVAQLQRYARVFDVTVADFFQFVHVRAGVALSAEQRGERLLQVIVAALAGAPPGEGTATR